MTQPRYLTVAEASAEFFVPERTIRSWIVRGLLDWAYTGTDTGLLAEADVARVEQATRRSARWATLLAEATTFASSSGASPAIPGHDHNVQD